MKKILLALLFLLPCALWGQASSRRSAYGLILSLDSQLLGIETLDGLEPDRTAVLSTHPKVGGGAGAFGRWAVANGLWVQSELLASYTYNQVLFRPDGPDMYRFFDVETPLHLVVTNASAQRLPLRASFLVGARLGWNFMADRSQRLAMYQERLGIDIGLGVEMNTRRWALQPELVYSHGMNNLHRVINSSYDLLVGRAMRDRLSLRLLVWRK